MSHEENDRKASRPLSEISHLFLSNIREQAGEQRQRPVRLPPSGGGVRPSVPPAFKLTDAEPVAPRRDPQPRRDAAEPRDAAERRRVTAVFAASQPSDSLVAGGLNYAASLAASGGRVGVISIDAGAVSVRCVACESFDESEPSRDMSGLADLLIDLNADVDRWLILVADPRAADGREVLRRADDWTMLSTCDHDGIVAGYRTLKGLAEREKSPLAIALVDAPNAMAANKTFVKLASVCRQFLDWDVRHDVLEDDVEHAGVQTLCDAPLDGRSLRATFAAVNELLALSPDEAADAAHFDEAEVDQAIAAEVEIPKIAQPIAKPVMKAVEAPAPEPVVETPKIESPRVEVKVEDVRTLAAHRMTDEVIEIADDASIVPAILRANGEWLTVPISAPMCPGATIAVSRQRGLVLVAQGAAAEPVAAALRWLDDSRSLIAMAMPQLSIDATQPVRVVLLVDAADRDAASLRPLLSDARASVRTYRRLRWGGRLGVLLDAA